MATGDINKIFGKDQSCGSRDIHLDKQKDGLITTQQVVVVRISQKYKEMFFITITIFVALCCITTAK